MSHWLKNSLDVCIVSKQVKQLEHQQWSLPMRWWCFCCCSQHVHHYPLLIAIRGMYSTWTKHLHGFCTTTQGHYWRRVGKNGECAEINVWHASGHCCPHLKTLPLETSCIWWSSSKVLKMDKRWGNALKTVFRWKSIPTTKMGLVSNEQAIYNKMVEDCNCHGGNIDLNDPTLWIDKNELEHLNTVQISISNTTWRRIEAQIEGHHFGIQINVSQGEISLCMPRMMPPLPTNWPQQHYSCVESIKYISCINFFHHIIAFYH